MNQIVKYSNLFLTKCGRLSELKYLLQKTLLGDHESWLVFLDLLEELKPELFISRPIDSLSRIYNALRTIRVAFDDYVGLQSGMISILIPNIFNFTHIAVGTHEDKILVYNKFNITQYSDDGSYRMIFNPPIMINNLLLESVFLNAKEIIVFGPDVEFTELYPKDDQYEKIKLGTIEYIDTFKMDLDNLKRIFYT